MLVEIWSDVVCPWCYVGKRNLEVALAGFEHAGEVTVEWRSYELDPNTPARVELSMDEVLERKYGMTSEQATRANLQMTELAATVGLEYHLDRVQIGNTFDAHRLIHLAATEGRAGEMKERLLGAYFTGDGPSRIPRRWSNWPSRSDSTRPGRPPCWRVTSSVPRCGPTRPGPWNSGRPGSRSSSSTVGSASPGRSRPTSCSDCSTGRGTPRRRRRASPA